MSENLKRKARAPEAITADSLHEYWRSHNEVWSAVDLERDPAGLANVCHAGAPAYLNRYAARCQERVFDRLLPAMPRGKSLRALDIGCGAARWSRRLQEAGFRVTAIDLQPALLERNRSAFPDIEFVYSSVQDFQGSAYDLITSVTVIQHNPEAEQERIAARLRSLLRTGGHALLMENIVDRLPTVFARTPDGWRRLFESHGFVEVVRCPYDFRGLQRLVRRMRRVRSRDDRSGPRPPAPEVMGGRDHVKRGIVALDSALEPLLVAVGARGATHCGFLLRAVS